MSTGSARDADDAGSRSAEEPAEQLVERLSSNGSRWVRKVVGRVREEIEDIVAEGRAMHEGSHDPDHGER
jgi:DNA-directed RNA polymerase specialized sigma24 family protein